MDKEKLLRLCLLAAAALCIVYGWMMLKPPTRQAAPPDTIEAPTRQNGALE